MKQYTRVKMRESMEIRGFSQNTIEIYINHVKNLAVYFNKSPHMLTPEHIHKYQVFLVQKKQVCWSTFNQAVCSMRFFLTMKGCIPEQVVFNRPGLLEMTGQLSTYPSRKNNSLVCGKGHISYVNSTAGSG